MATATTARTTQQDRFNDSSNPPTTILHALHDHLEQHPDATAYVFLESDSEQHSITFRELSQSAQALAVDLLKHAKAGDRAMLMYAPGLEFIKAFLGCLYARVIAVPAYAPKKNRNADRVLRIAKDCQPRLLLCSKEAQGDVERELAKPLRDAKVIVTEDIDLPQEFEADELPLPKSTNVAFLQYTSGATASPKGVIVKHSSIAANEESIRINFEHDKDSIMISWLPMFHDMGLIGGVLQPLYVGFKSVLMAPGSFMKEPLRWLQAISDFGGTTSGGPDFAYDYCVRRISDDQKQGLDLSSWKTAYNGSEPVRAETLDTFVGAFAANGFQPQAFFPCYGLAEVTLFAAGGPVDQVPNRYRFDAEALDSHRLEPCSDTIGPKVSKRVHTAVSCGSLARDVDVAIVDAATRQRLTKDHVGEIWLTGKSVASGYWNMEEETAATFQASVAGDSRTWMRTGDFGFIRDGELYVTGRLKDLIIIRGRNIYPQDIERIVESEIDFIEPNTCAAVSVEVDDSEQLVIIAEGTRDLVRTARKSEQAVKSNLQAAIAAIRDRIISEFEVSVIDIVFVRPTTFPRTSSGKVQRRLCSRQYSNEDLNIVVAFPLDDASTPRLNQHPKFSHESTSQAHETDLVQHICTSIEDWARDEQRSLPPLDHETKFSALGIDSVAAANLCLWIEKATGARIEASVIYEQESVGRLAQHMSRFRDNFWREAIKPSTAQQIDNSDVHHLLATTKTTESSSRTAFSRQQYTEHFLAVNNRSIRFRENGHDWFETTIESVTDNYVTVHGEKLLMLATYSYLSMFQDPTVTQAANDALTNFGPGVHGTRLLSGTTNIHRQLEQELARFMQAENAIVFPNGFLTNLSTINAVVAESGVVIGDELIHASLADGCRICGGTVESFRHNDLKHLESHLRKHVGSRILIVVDGVYSMDGDIAPVPEIVALARQYGALLMVDEAHSLGVLGEHGRGIQEHFDLPPDAIDIKMGTMSKTLPGVGGFVAGSHELVDFLKYQARGFIFSASLPVPQAAASLEALRVIQQKPERTQRLQEVVQKMLLGLRELSYRIPDTDSAIIPVIFDTEEETLEAVRFCRENGLFVVPVFYPAVPMDAPRIRITLMSSLTNEEIDRALKVFAKLAKQLKMGMAAVN